MQAAKSTAESPVEAGYHSAAPDALDAEFEARWAAWHAPDLTHERALRRKFLILVPVGAIAAAIVYGLWRR